MIIRPVYGRFNKPPAARSLDRRHPANKDLVGFWPMWEGAGTQVLDISGFNTHGILRDQTCWSGTEDGVGLNLYDFLLDHYVDFNPALPSHLNITGELTISCIFRSTDSAVSPGLLVGAVTSAGTARAYSLRLAQSPYRASFRWGTGFSLDSTWILSAHRRYHIIATRSGSPGAWTAKMFINGELNAVTTTAIDPTDIATVVSIGGTLNSEEYEGFIYDVRIWNTALPDAICYMLMRDPYGVYDDPMARFPVWDFSTSVASAVNFRKTLSALGTRVGARQTHVT